MSKTIKFSTSEELEKYVLEAQRQKWRMEKREQRKRKKVKQ